MKVLITGARGQLGSALTLELAAHDGVETIATGREQLDLLSRDSIHQAIAAARPDWVINCAAYTNVDAAEDDSETAYAINERAVGHVADACAPVGARLVHISTDYVFSGSFAEGDRRSYIETDAVGPLGVYGASKLAGELRLEAHDTPSIVLRTSWVYGGREKNFLATMLRLGRQRRDGGEPLGVVADQHGTPTDCGSLAAQIVRLIDSDTGAAGLRGVFHASCEGQTTWCGFTREIFRQLDWDVTVNEITTAEFPTEARRPQYSVLENARLKEAGLLTLPAWKEGLARALAMQPVE